MNINVGIIDQQVTGLATRLKEKIELALEATIDETKAKSIAFVVLCAKVMLELSDDEAIDTLCEGGNDFGVDAIYIGDIVDYEFSVTILQGKYNHANLDGVRGLPQSGVEKAVLAVASLFNPSVTINVNPRLRTHLEEIRSLILDGNIPRVQVLLCNNGAIWKHPEAQEFIDRANFGERVNFEHVNHDKLVKILQSTAPVKDTLQFSGKAIVEDLNYSRVFVGKVAVQELARLMESHGDRLLERNIRRYLGLHGNRVNEGIQATLMDADDRSNFYFYNNGVTFICTRFDYNALQSENNSVRVEGLQIINGGQTSKTVHQTLSSLAGTIESTGLEAAFVLVRLYQVPPESTAFVQMITYATNSQNPVDLKDLRSNDALQRSLEMSIKNLGYEYRRQRSGDASATAKEISVGTAAEAVLSVWRRHPQQAKFRTTEHFGKLYGDIFTKELNAAQVVIAVLLFRIAENKRKRPPTGSPELVRYGSCFSAMLMGQFLLADLGVDVGKLTHQNFEAAKALVEKNGEEYFDKSVEQLEAALKQLYAEAPVSLLRLSATFRRGDLLSILDA